MIQVIHRALDILEIMSKDRSRTFLLSEIAAGLNLNAGTCANIIKTLVNRGYIEHRGRKSGYCLGPKSFLLTGNYAHKQQLTDSAAEPMEQLSEKLREGCILSVLKDNLRVIIHEVKSNQELQVVNLKEKNAYDSSTGRMILACLTDQEKMEFIRKYGLPSVDIWAGIEDEEDLMTELHIIQKKQLAVQISGAQIIGLAVPVLLQGKVVASLGVYLPQARFAGVLADQVPLELRRTAEMINNRLMD